MYVRLIRTSGGSEKSVFAPVRPSLSRRLLICIEAKYMRSCGYPTKAPPLFMQRNNFTERLFATSSLLSVDTTRQARLPVLRATRNIESQAFQPGRSVGLFARSVERGTRRDAGTLSRPVYTSARRTAEQCIAICTLYDYTCDCICVYASGDYVATLLFQRRLATRSDSVMEGENEIRFDETLTRTTCHTAHTRTRTRIHAYISTFLFP